LSPAARPTTATSAKPSPSGRFCSLTQSAWARDFYDSKIAVGKSRHQTLRALGNRWLEVLWHCLHIGVVPE